MVNTVELGTIRESSACRESLVIEGPSLLMAATVMQMHDSGKQRGELAGGEGREQDSLAAV